MNVRRERTPMSSSDPDRRLLLQMRHGKAESGFGQVSWVRFSDALRTPQTWRAVASRWPGCGVEVSIHEEIYSGGAAELLSLPHGAEGQEAVVMVVGEKPTILGLSSLLAAEDS